MVPSTVWSATFPPERFAVKDTYRHKKQSFLGVQVSHQYKQQTKSIHSLVVGGSLLALHLHLALCALRLYVALPTNSEAHAASIYRVEVSRA